MFLSMTVRSAIVYDDETSELRSQQNLLGCHSRVGVRLETTERFSYEQWNTCLYRSVCIYRTSTSLLSTFPQHFPNRISAFSSCPQHPFLNLFQHGLPLHHRFSPVVFCMATAFAVPNTPTDGTEKDLTHTLKTANGNALQLGTTQHITKCNGDSDRSRYRSCYRRQCFGGLMPSFTL